ncbi:MAG: tetratricopeptide repeat protein, partial [Bacteroidota bacterium]
MKHTFGIHTLILILFSFVCFGQTNTDSLEKILPQVKNEEKAELLNQLSKSYLRKSPEISFQYANEALKISRKLNDKKLEADAMKSIGDTYYYRNEIVDANKSYQKAQLIYKEINNFVGISEIYKSFGNLQFANSKYDSAEYFYNKAIGIKKDINDLYGLSTLYTNISSVYLYTGRRTEAINILNESLKLCDQVKNKLGKAMTLVNLANIYYRDGVFEKAVETNFDALEMAEEIEDQSLISSIYTNLGNIYSFFKNYDKSLEFHLSAMEIDKQRGDENGVSVSLNNIGNAYLAKLELDSALYFYLESIKIKENNNKSRGYAITANNIGEVYARKGNYDIALDYLNQSLKINQQLNSKESIIRNKMNIGSVYIKTKDYKKAELLLIESLSMANDNGFNDKYIIYRLLSELYEATGRFKESLKFHKQYSKEKDSVLSTEKEQAVARIRASYDLEKQKQEIEILSKDKALHVQTIEKQKVLRNTLMLGSIFILIFTGLIYYNYRNKNRANKILSIQNEQIKKKNQKIKHQAFSLSRINHELEKLSIVASKTDNAIIIARPDGSIEWINEGFKRLYGYTLDEYINEKGATLVDTRSNPDIEKIIAKAKSEKKSQIYESEIIAKNGKKYKIQTTLTPIIDDDGGITKIITIDSDISQLKRVEKELQKLLITKDKFFSIIAHDLKNPFNSLMGLSQLLVYGFDRMSKEKVKHFHSNLYQISKNGYELLINLLEWSRSQMGSIKFNPEQINLTGITEETFSLYQSKAKQKD